MEERSGEGDRAPSVLDFVMRVGVASALSGMVLGVFGQRTRRLVAVVTGAFALLGWVYIQIAMSTW